MSALSEAMLVVYKDVVVIQVFYDLTEDDVFHKFTYHAC